MIVIGQYEEVRGRHVLGDLLRDGPHGASAEKCRSYRFIASAEAL